MFRYMYKALYSNMPALIAFLYNNLPTNNFEISTFSQYCIISSLSQLNNQTFSL